MEDTRIKEDSSYQNNTLLNDLNEMPENIPNKTIEIKGSNIDIKLNDTSNIFSEDENKCPYLRDGEYIEIPEIKLLNENLMKFNNKKNVIDFYNKKISTNFVEDNFYNNCGKFQKNLNRYFCVNCSKNLCDKWKENWETKIHNLKQLDIMKESTDILIEKI